MSTLRVGCGFLLSLAAAWGQLTTDQKITDFQHMADLYAKLYAPYEWKRDVFGFDLLNLRPWLERVRATRDDVDFYQVCVEYVASLKSGGHDRFILPSNYSASLGFTVDIYDGKVLIDSVNRTLLPASRFPFAVGDELVSVDGQPVEDLIREFTIYGSMASSGIARRSAAALIASRSQSRIPRMDMGETAEIVVLRQNGERESYAVRWNKSGTPLNAIPPVPDLPRFFGKFSAAAAPDRTIPEEILNAPDYMLPLIRLQHIELEDRDTILNQSGRSPIFAMPENFVQRLGRATNDVYFSGTYITAEGLRIGFIRVPHFSPPSLAVALQQFDAEIAYFEQNTDGLVVDEMRNGGGYVSLTNDVCRRLIPTAFRTLGYELRATSSWIASFSNSLESARRQKAPGWVIQLYDAMLRDVQTANAEYRGRTGPLPLDDYNLITQPARDRSGRVTAYTKPLIVLVDEAAGSGGDAFPATIQDNGRGPIVGMPTMGLGGTVTNFPAGAYNEATTRITESLMNRRNAIITAEFPAAPYIENIGVRPDIALDYMTRENLLTGGRPFVAAFTAIISDQIRAKR